MNRGTEKRMHFPLLAVAAAWGIASTAGAQAPLAIGFDPTTNNAHIIISPPMNWTEAFAVAQQMGGHLSTIANQEENDLIAALAAHVGTEGVWIGLTDQVVEGVFEWVSGEPVVYTNWFPLEPFDASGIADGVQLYSFDGRWDDFQPTPLLAAVEIEFDAPAGACVVAGSCTLSTEADCIASGGTYAGDGVLCGGACCTPDGTCAQMSEADCNLAGGSYEGDDTDCGSAACPVLVANDNCEGATSVGEGVFAFDTALAGNDASACNRGRPFNEVWFAYTASVTGEVLIRTGNITEDTYLAVYDDCDGTTILGCDDDCSGRASVVSITASEGQTYYVEVGNFNLLATPSAGLLSIAHLPEPPNPAPPPQVWSGETFTFTKANGVDALLPEHQDAITPSVAISRGDNGPLFNPRVSLAGPDCFRRAPFGTEWAFGRASDFSTLTFTDFVSLSGDSPPSLIGQDLVLHIIQENIYIDVRLTEWTQGGEGGGFSYQRAVGCPCDQTGDTAVDINDLLVFLGVWFNENGTSVPAGSGADYDMTGNVTIADLLGFLTCWFAAQEGPCI